MSEQASSSEAFDQEELQRLLESEAEAEFDQEELQRLLESMVEAKSESEEPTWTLSQLERLLEEDKADEVHQDKALPK